MKTEMQVVARDAKRRIVWLRTPYKQYGWRILTLSDEVLPWGMKTATRVLVEWDGNVTTNKVGYHADVKVVEDVSPEGSRTTEDN